jgi:hypothetical protein
VKLIYFDELTVLSCCSSFGLKFGNLWSITDYCFLLEKIFQHFCLKEQIRKAVGQGFFLFGAEIEAHYYCQFVKVNLNLL